MVINLKKRFLLYKWFNDSNRCYKTKRVAKPGLSLHESGLSVDINDYQRWKIEMESAGCKWFGLNDTVHFTCRGIDLRSKSTSIRAFQKLWNCNNPLKIVNEDGIYGTQTEINLLASPSAGWSNTNCQNLI
jgi:hypothetical protein